MEDGGSKSAEEKPGLPSWFRPFARDRVIRGLLQDAGVDPVPRYLGIYATTGEYNFALNLRNAMLTAEQDQSSFPKTHSSMRHNLGEI